MPIYKKKKKFINCIPKGYNKNTDLFRTITLPNFKINLLIFESYTTVVRGRTNADRKLESHGGFVTATMASCW